MKRLGRHSRAHIVCLTLVLLGLSLEAPLAAQAQTAAGPTIAQMQISIWPEYDDPRVLVILRGRFADSTGFPRDVSFPIPAGAEVNAAAYTDAEGKLLSQSWKVDSGPSGQTVTYNLPTPSFQVEYYYEGLTGKDDKKLNFSTQFQYPITALAVDIQRPRTATNFQLDPKPESQSNDSQGFQYGLYNFKDFPANKPLSFKVSYTKTDPSPSVERSAAPPPEVAQPATAAGAPALTRTTSSGPSPIVIVLATIGVGGLVVVGGILYLQRRQSQAEEYDEDDWDDRGRPPRGGGPANFCTQCGTRLRPGVRFCPECGTKVRGGGTGGGEKGSERRSPAPTGKPRQAPAPRVLPKTRNRAQARSISPRQILLYGVLPLAAVVVVLGIAGVAPGLLGSTGAPVARADVPLPPFVRSSPPQVRQAYQWAISYSDDLMYIPCFCGCGQHSGHRAVRDCFARDVPPDGNNIQWDDHGANCDMCVDEVLDSVKWLKDGVPLKQVREKIVASYGSRGPSTDTPPVPGA